MLNNISSFYKGKKIFLTGHTGFKGSWLLYWLYSLGAEVKGYALNPIGSTNLYDQISGYNLCESIIGDIRDRNKLELAIERFQPDIIFHLAAQPLVLLSYQQPELTYETNVMGTGYLLSAVKKVKSKCAIVVVTTDKVYENREWIYPYRENDPLGGYDPYSSSKAACEILIQSYRRSFFNEMHINTHQKGIAVARAGNVIGGGDWSEDRIIPDIIKALNNKKPVIIRNPNSVRPWQHVLEPLGGYLLLGMKLYNEPLVYGEAWNFGPHLADTFPVISLVKKAIAIWGDGEYQILQNEIKEHEAGLLKLDISKAAAILKWQPIMSCDEAIQKTIAWYKNASSSNISELVYADIKAYLLLSENV